MDLPKKITPDRIKASIVQVYFKTQLQFELLVGILYQHFSKLGYTYSNQPLNAPQIPFDLTRPISLEFNIMPLHYFFNEELKMELKNDGSIIFNCINKYIGWENYFPIIKKVLNEITNFGIIEGYSRIGIRYITEFPNIDLTEKLNFSYSVKNITPPIRYGNFNFEWLIDDYRAIINLHYKNPAPVNSLSEDENEKIFFVSRIDIDVIMQDISYTSLEEFIQNIDYLHHKEKEIFFGLLTHEFLEELNPEY